LITQNPEQGLDGARDSRTHGFSQRRVHDVYHVVNTGLYNWLLTWHQTLRQTWRFDTVQSLNLQRVNLRFGVRQESQRLGYGPTKARATTHVAAGAKQHVHVHFAALVFGFF
jgi:hypothetical protein